MHLFRTVSIYCQGMFTETYLPCSEKNGMVEEAQRLITAIKQMESSLIDEKANGQFHLDHDELHVTYPLNRCLTSLREMHGAISKLHQERFEQVKSR